MRSKRKVNNRELCSTCRAVNDAKGGEERFGTTRTCSTVNDITVGFRFIRATREVL